MDKTNLKYYKLYSICNYNTTHCIPQDTIIESNLSNTEYDIKPYFLFYLKWTETDRGIEYWTLVSNTLQAVLDRYLIVGVVTVCDT